MIFNFRRTNFLPAVKIWNLKAYPHRASSGASSVKRQIGSIHYNVTLWRSTWRLGMGLGPIFEHHNAFQWELITWRAAWRAAWRSVWLCPYTSFSIHFSVFRTSLLRDHRKNTLKKCYCWNYASVFSLLKWDLWCFKINPFIVNPLTWQKRFQTFVRKTWAF